MGFEPLIVVVQSGVEVRLSVDLTDTDAPDDLYRLLAISDGREIAWFRGTKGVVSASFRLDAPGGYALLKGSALMGIIESVSDLGKADLQQVRDSYFGGR